MKLRKTTAYFTIGIVLAILGYDVFAYVNGGQDATISSMVITDWAVNHPLFTGFLGFVMGHFFLTKISSDLVYNYPAVGFGVGVFVGWYLTIPFAKDYPGVTFILISLLGGVFWPLAKVKGGK